MRCFTKWPKEYYNSLTVSRFDDAIASPVCTLGKFAKLRGKEKAKALLVIILADAIEFFNVSNSMNPAQIAQTVEIILDCHGWLKIDDFKLCFNQAKRGFFGQVYRMDGNVILSWIERYIIDRINFADERSYAEHNNSKESFGRRDDGILDKINGKLNS